MTRNVDAQGTINTFNIQGAGASGPSGSLVGDSGTNAFVFSGSSKLIGSIQGGGSSTLNYAAYSSGVTVNLGNGTNGTATGVSGTVAGITAVIGSNFNDTLNAGTVPGVALTGRAGHQHLERHRRRRQRGGIDRVELHADQHEVDGDGRQLHRQPHRHHGRGVDRRQCHQQYLHRQRLDRERVAVRPGGHRHRDGEQAAGFTLTNTSLSAPHMSLTLSGITTANLTDTGSGHTFTITGWTGSGSLNGTADTLVDSVVRQRHPDQRVAGGDGHADADLERDHDRQPDRHGRWQHLHGQRLDGERVAHRQATTADTVTASKSAGFTLTNTSLSSTDGMSLGLTGITTANLTDTSAGNTFTVSGWTGAGSLTGSDGAS